MSIPYPLDNDPRNSLLAYMPNKDIKVPKDRIRFEPAQKKLKVEEK